jgi:hypothetical protein
MGGSCSTHGEAEKYISINFCWSVSKEKITWKTLSIGI